MRAVKALGYKNRNQAMRDISVRAGRDNNYLKLRRDEFDALPDSSSSRKGWRNREPISTVVEMAAYLKTFSFEELTDIVKTLISEKQDYVDSGTDTNVQSISDMDEEEIERIVNATDSTSTIIYTDRNAAVRRYNKSIIRDLKKLYRGKCQICGTAPFGDVIDICEAHHIDYYSTSMNNNAQNIVILCPNHHRLVHKFNLTFDRERVAFFFEPDEWLICQLNYHIGTQTAGSINLEG